MAPCVPLIRLIVIGIEPAFSLPEKFVVARTKVPGAVDAVAETLDVLFDGLGSTLDEPDGTAGLLSAGDRSG